MVLQIYHWIVALLSQQTDECFSLKEAILKADVIVKYQECIASSL